MFDRDTRTANLAATLEAEGIPQARARAIAEQVIEQHAGSNPGTVYAAVDSLGIGRIWERATFAGVRRLVLDIEASAAKLADDEGLLTVRVLDSEKWAEWTDRQDVQVSALAGVVQGLDEPTAASLKAFGNWQEAQARARAEDMN